MGNDTVSTINMSLPEPCLKMLSLKNLRETFQFFFFFNQYNCRNSTWLAKFEPCLLRFPVALHFLLYHSYLFLGTVLSLGWDKLPSVAISTVWAFCEGKQTPLSKGLYILPACPEPCKGISVPHKYMACEHVHACLCVRIKIHSRKIVDIELLSTARAT